VALVLRPTGGEGVGVETTSAILTDVVRSNPHVMLLRLLDAAGKGPFVQSRPIAPTAEEGLEAILRDAFAANLKGKPVRRDVVNLPGEAPLMLVSLPLLTRTGEVAGSLQGLVSLADLARRIGEESSRGVVVDVVDREGLIVFSSEQERAGVSAARHPLVSQFLRAPVRLTKSYIDPLGGSPGQVLGSLCPVDDPPWAVVTARDQDTAFAAMKSMARRTVLIALATGLVAMLAGGLLARRITSPLRNLAEVTTAVAGGDFARRVPARSRNEFGQLAENFNTMAIEVERYVLSLRHALQENQELLVDSIRALAAAIDAKSPYTRGHSERVSEYAVAIARQLGLDEGDQKKLEISALLHDVGKIGIDDAILVKPDTLTEQEFAQMRAHPLKGSAIVSPIKRLRDMLPGIRSHHENWSGGGYPDGLSGEEIPLVARIIAAADVFDAMTTHRPYQTAMSLEYVFTRMRELAGARLDPSVVDAFLAAVQSGDLVPLKEVEVA
jgi:HD-GYP domain-containing protein (c-di-GMP phosphodiesterase class II)